MTDYSLKRIYRGVPGPLLLIVCDGFGVAEASNHNCVTLAESSFWMKLLADAREKNLYCELAAHGVAVGLPGNKDMGNSEVGHNALGSGQIVDQGAKLVNKSLEDRSMFRTESWKNIGAKALAGATVHFVGLLSDGGVHSNISQLTAILKQCSESGFPRVRFHVLTDGRDVPQGSGIKFLKQLKESCTASGMDYRIASGGGRMYVTMDRYGADWNIVKRGYDAMVHGIIDPAIVPEISEKYKGVFKDAEDWWNTVTVAFSDRDDQFYPPFVVVDDAGEPIGAVRDDDVVINFNFRGDRALEISRAMTEPDFQEFHRGNHPSVDYYGLLIYDTDKMIPKNSLCPNPKIFDVLSQYMLGSGITSYACAETHKFGHMTYFWNGNRSGYMDESRELFEEVPSKPATPEQISKEPAMAAEAVTDRVLAAIEGGKYKFLRLNFANGDMCGHTGLIAPTTRTVEIMFQQIERLVTAITERNGAVIITADHGNCEQMMKKGKPLTSHTLHPVPFIIIDPSCQESYRIETGGIAAPGLANVAATVCNILGFEAPAKYHPSLVKFRSGGNL